MSLSWDEALRLAGIESMHPHASRGGFYGSIITGTLIRIVTASVVGLWARGAIVWTAQYNKLYAALAFWVLWRLPSTVREAVEIANRMVPKCPDCGSTHVEPEHSHRKE